MSHSKGRGCKDLILDNFEEIKSIAVEYGINLDEDTNLVWNFDGTHNLSLVWNCKTWLLRVIDGRYALFDQNTAGNNKRSPGKMHFQKDFSSFYSVIKYIASSHHPAYRVKTKKNASTFRMDEIFKQINNKS